MCIGEIKKVTEIGKKELTKLTAEHASYKAKLTILWRMLSHVQVIELIERNKDIKNWFDTNDVLK